MGQTLSNRTPVTMAAAVGCSDRTVWTHRSNLRRFEATRAPSNGSPGPRRQTTPSMLNGLRELWLEKPGLYRDEMVVFLYDEFEILVGLAT